MYGSAVLLQLFQLVLLVSKSRYFCWFDPAVPVVHSLPSGVTPNSQALHDGSPPSVLKWMNEMQLNAAIYYLRKCQLAAHIQKVKRYRRHKTVLQNSVFFHWSCPVNDLTALQI